MGVFSRSHAPNWAQLWPIRGMVWTTAEKKNATWRLPGGVLWEPLGPTHFVYSLSLALRILFIRYAFLFIRYRHCRRPLDPGCWRFEPAQSQEAVRLFQHLLELLLDRWHEGAP